MNRRTVLKSIGFGLALAGLNKAVPSALAQIEPVKLKFGAPQPMTWALLQTKATKLATTPYAPPFKPAPDVTYAIDYEQHGKIQYKKELAAGIDGAGAYPVTFFHLGRFFQKSVKMHIVEKGQAREILYSPNYFDMPANSPAKKLPSNSGFAGFRFQETKSDPKWPTQDWVAFLGASYFRAIGALGQYGLSARAVALNTASQIAEEFPDFTEIYIEPQNANDKFIIVYALLDGSSIAGAYQFIIHRDTGVKMEISSHITLRQDVERLGLAPLTSMYWFSETRKTQGIDWRPEVHDSDGLALWRGNGERVWRPLNNPPRPMASAFVDESPKGFGLLQRDRNFENYLDGVNYDKRPSLWVEPVSDWGRGSVQLIELSTDDEIHDNIVAMWVPDGASKAGNTYSLDYKLHWQADEPYFPQSLGYTHATRMGHGGEPGKPRPQDVRKIVIDYAGDPITNILPTDKPEADVQISHGTLSHVFAEWVVGTHRWRISFDVTATSKEPIEARVFLKLNGKPLTETTLMQIHMV